MPRRRRRPSPEFRRARARRVLGVAIYVVLVCRVALLTLLSELHALTTGVLVVLALLIANHAALWFVPLGCSACRGMLHRAWLWSPFTRVCPHCWTVVPQNPARSR